MILTVVAVKNSVFCNVMICGLVDTDVSEQPTATSIRAEESAIQGKKMFVTGKQE
jgi:hypothetical protein